MLCVKNVVVFSQIIIYCKRLGKTEIFVHEGKNYNRQYSKSSPNR